MKKAEEWFVDYIYKQDALSEKEKLFMTTWGIKIVDFLKKLSTGIISFLVLHWIFIRMYRNYGFEETMLTLVILFIVMIKMGWDKK